MGAALDSGDAGMRTVQNNGYRTLYMKEPVYLQGHRQHAHSF